MTAVAKTMTTGLTHYNASAAIYALILIKHKFRFSFMRFRIMTPMARTAAVRVGSYSARRTENTATTTPPITTAVFPKYISIQTGRLHTDEGIHRRL